MTIIKKILILVLFSFAASIFAQQYNTEFTDNGFIITLKDDQIDYHIKYEGNYRIVDYYKYADPTKGLTYKLPYKVILVAIPYNSTPKISIVDFNEEILHNTIPALNPASDLFNDSLLTSKILENDFLPTSMRSNNLVEIIGYGWYRLAYNIILRINNYSFNDKEIYISKKEKIKIKFEFDQGFSSYFQINEKKQNYDPLTNYVIPNYFFANSENINKNFYLNDTTGNWIDYNLTYLKLGTGEDGIYKISKKDLESIGIDVLSIVPKTIQLFESGKEIPLYFVGKDDNKFDENDYLIFYGRKNYSKKNYKTTNSKNEEYTEYLNRFNDTTFYFLTWGKSNGKRMLSKSFTQNIRDTLDYYKSIHHVEKNSVLFFANNDELKNQLPDYKGNKTWYYHQSEWLYSGTTRSYSFNTQDLVQNKDAYFYFKGASGGSNKSQKAHNITLRVNGNLLDSIAIDRYAQVLLKGKINSSLLKQNGNIINIKNYNNGTTINTIAVDWYEFSYPKKLKYEGNNLVFEINEDVDLDLRAMKIENVNKNEFYILKIDTTQTLFQNYVIKDNFLTFVDSVKHGDKYVVAEKENLLTPKYYSFNKFKNLRNSKNQLDYVAVTHKKFLQTATKYVETISKLFNVTTELFNIEEIYNEFSYGIPDPGALRLFLFSTFQNRNIPKPSYLLLIGDANYDFKDYFTNSTGVQGGRNYIPSYGYPVGDNWFVVWDNNIHIPQMKVGRIPINNSDELDFYLTKVINISNAKYDDFNKRYLFFSGGPSNDPNQINSLKSTNDFIINNYIKPNPIAGNYTHFYKTTNPQTDFGPYSSEEISKAIKNGGLFISYLGHSGTATWDNSISETEQLSNSLNRNSLITDFGCSTNKFAEPDIICFGERFTIGKNGQAIGYVGNSSLGFTSTAYSVPKYFYESLLKLDSKEIGDAIIYAKSKMFNDLGYNSSTIIFSLTNTLLGDPVVKIPIPKKPNLKINSDDLKFQNNNLTSNLDYTNLFIHINNYGLSSNDSINISIEHFYLGRKVKLETKKILLPQIRDSINFKVEIKNLPGNHSLKINLDDKNEIDEIYEDDNTLIVNFNVYSTDLRDIFTNQIENTNNGKLLILNPVYSTEQDLSIKVQFAKDDKFQNVMEQNIKVDTFRTIIPFPKNSWERIWFRYKLNINSSDFTPAKSIRNIINGNYIVDDSISFLNQNLTNLTIQNGNLKISKKEEKISVVSAGWSAGATCVISKNGINLLSNTYFAGMGIVVLNPFSFEVESSEWYELFNNTQNIKKLTDFINRIPNGKIVIMGVSDDAANNITIDLKNAIKTLGSIKIDNLQFRGSWALIGRKGASSNEVKEVLKGPYDGLIYIDSTFVRNQKEGSFETKYIGPVYKWKSIETKYELTNNSKIVFNILGKNKNGQETELSSFDDKLDLTNINAEQYQFIKIKTNLIADSMLNSPSLKMIRINYQQIPELGLNYQTVSVFKDSVELGEKTKLSFKVYNVGETTAKNFKVKVEAVSKSESIKLLEQVVDSIQSDKYKIFSTEFSTIKSSGNYNINISVDSENQIDELYEDNNFYSVPIFVKKNSKPAKLNLTIDGNDIFDGDYISSNPKIKIELRDESLVPIFDTTKVSIYLNNKRISYKGNENNVIYSFSSSNPKFVVDYSPNLVDGDYTLKVIGKNATDDLIDSTGIVKKFKVKNSLELIEFYNYPNPMKDETDFTFKLTSIPDELKINIYTIAGRKIKEIQLQPSQLKYDFNTIHWNGRDDDGNKIANGIYLCKVILKKENKTIDKILKLAKVE